MSVEAKDDISEEDEEIPNQSSQNDGECSEEKSSRPSSNIYTPLLTGARLLSTSVNAFRSKLDKDISKDRISKPNLAVVSHQTRIQRSSVRPFFCCGSEVSLVSLVDNLQLKDQNATGLSKPNKIECIESSEEEEESALNSNQSVKSSVPPSSRSLLRKKKKDKHVAKKKFWSLRLRGRWNTHWRVSQRSGCHRVDMSHSSMGLSQGTFTSIGSPGTTRRASRPHDALNSNQFMSSSQLDNLDSLNPIDDAFRIREIDEELGQGVEIEHNMFSQTLRSNLHFSNSMLDMLRQRRLAETIDSESSRSSPVYNFRWKRKHVSPLAFCYISCVYHNELDNVLSSEQIKSLWIPLKIHIFPRDLSIWCCRDTSPLCAIFSIGTSCPDYGSIFK
ncbi:hypothetical protein RRG08_006488 [Elysia crispata]|uniref:Uncharacterized protein n=1 Tax=Elysia crispata TaxID=231223 RepID=A0AAE0YBP5_9GAST|nr:hypothetical protein RRG08_006488 [Elysia crispata]